MNEQDSIQSLLQQLDDEYAAIIALESVARRQAEEIARLKVEIIRMGEDSIPTDNELIICEAFDRHIKECHQAQFEVCHDPQCKAAYELEKKGNLQ